MTSITSPRSKSRTIARKILRLPSRYIMPSLRISTTRVTASRSISIPPSTAVSASIEKGGVRSKTVLAKVGEASIKCVGGGAAES